MLRIEPIALAMMLMALSPITAAAQDCNQRLAQMNSIIADHDPNIPSRSLNRMFTLQQQAAEACEAGADELADRLIGELAALLAEDIESRRLDALREQVPPPVEE